jgi:hypothetical protein
VVDGVEGGLQQARLVGQLALAQARLFGLEVGDVRVDADQAAVGHAVFADLQGLTGGQLHLAAPVLSAFRAGWEQGPPAAESAGGFGQHVTQGAVAGVAGKAVELAEGLVAQQDRSSGSNSAKPSEMFSTAVSSCRRAAVARAETSPRASRAAVSSSVRWRIWSSSTTVVCSRP